MLQRSDLSSPSSLTSLISTPPPAKREEKDERQQDVLSTGTKRNNESEQTKIQAQKKFKKDELALVDEDKEEDTDESTDEEEEEAKENEEDRLILESVRGISFFEEENQEEIKSKGHRSIFKALEMKKIGDKNYKRIEEAKYILKRDDMALIELSTSILRSYFEVIFGEFSRMISPSHPEMRMGVLINEDFSISSRGGMFVASQFLTDIDKGRLMNFSKEELINTIFIKNEWKGFGTCVALAFAFQNGDFRLGNMAVRENKIIINYDGDQCFVDEIKRTNEDIALLPSLSAKNLTTFRNWLADWIQCRNKQFMPELINATHFREELNFYLFKNNYTSLFIYRCLYKCLGYSKFR